MKKKIKIEVSFRAALKNIDFFCIKCERLLKQNDLNEYIFPVQMLLRESLTNAVVYGCKTNNELIVKGSFTIYKNKIIIEVKDPGNGFDWKAVENREYSASLDSGRGVIIMKKYSDKYSYNKKGNRITIIKKIILKEKDNEQ